MQATPTSRLIEMQIVGTLSDYVMTRRAAGKSWRQITLDIRDDTGEDVSFETLRGWFADSEPVAS